MGSPAGRRRSAEAVRTVPVEERRARLALRHRLAPSARARTPEEVADSLVAIHSSDPASLHLETWARMVEPGLAATERALYDDRTLVRMHGMRRTLWVVDRDLVPSIQAGAAHPIAIQERRRVIQMVAEGGISDDPTRWLAAVESGALAALHVLGEATMSELARAEPRLAERITLAAGKRYEARIAIGTRILPLLGMEARVVRGRPVGSWITSQYRWLPVDAIFPGGIPHVPAHEARAEVVRRWLASFGPGTEADLRWWTGWTARMVRAALVEVGAVEVDLEPDAAMGYLLPDDLEPVTAVGPWAALLPGLDATTMGWWDRGWYVGPHARRLFDMGEVGNAGPTIWLDGRVVGGWGQRPDGRVVIRLLEDTGAEATERVEAEAGRLEALLDGRRVTARFRTPLEKELSA